MVIELNKKDIIIVGGGPAGISTWLHLHKDNPDLAERAFVIEKDKFPRDKVCGGGLGGWTGHVLKYLNIELDIPSLLISDVEFIFGDDRYMLHQPNSFRMVQRLEFDNALVKTAIDRGLEIHENESFLDFSRKREKLFVNTTKSRYEIKALVGADGSLSKVRRNIRDSEKSYLAPTLEVFSPSQYRYDQEYEKRKITVDMTPIKKDLQGYIWHVPCLKNGKPHIGHGLADFRVYKTKKRANMKNIFEEELYKRNIKISQRNWLGHPIRCFSFDDNISKKNILLVGDAAGIEPAFGGGMHFALSYGGIASRELSEAFNLDDFSFKNYIDNIKSHLVGKFLSKCTRISLDLYNNKLDPIEAAKQVFTIQK
jgi:flavin-dependent dehydrogenase